MSLSSDEKAILDATYERARRGRKYRGVWGGALIGLTPALTRSIQTLGDPHASHRAIAFFSGLIGLIFGIGIISLAVASQARKRDEGLLRFFEKYFPEECSWKQEEKILAQVEDIRLKAKVDFLIYEADRHPVN